MRHKNLFVPLPDAAGQAKGPGGPPPPAIWNTRPDDPDDR
jgi:hypothetical protein